MVEKVDSEQKSIEVDKIKKLVDEVSEGNENKVKKGNLGFKNQYSDIFKGIVKPGKKGLIDKAKAIQNQNNVD